MAAKTVICFDLDGTLADTFEAHVRSFNFSFQKNNLPTKTYSEIIAGFGDTAEHIVKHLFPKLTDRKLAQVITDKVNFFDNNTFKLVKKIDDVSEALKKLGDSYALALVSGSTRDEIILTLKEIKIPIKTFDIILGKGEFEPKPSGDALKKIAKKLGCRVEYYIGDTIYDVQAGKNAGVKTVAVLSGANDIKTLGAEDPTMIIKSVAVLPDILEGDL